MCLHARLCLQLLLTGIFQHHPDDNVDVYMLSALSLNRQSNASISVRGFAAQMRLISRKS